MSVNTDSQHTRALDQLRLAKLRLDHSIRLLETTDSNSVSGIASVGSSVGTVVRSLNDGHDFLMAILIELAETSA